MSTTPTTRGPTGCTRLTRERLAELLAEPGPDQPAHDPATQYVAAPAKVQAAFAVAAKIHPQVAKVARMTAPLARKAYPLIRREAIKQHALASKKSSSAPPVCTVVGLAAPRERRAARTSTPTRAGPDGDSDPDQPPRRVESRDDAIRWAAERRKTLTALTSPAQLDFEAVAS